MAIPAAQSFIEDQPSVQSLSNSELDAMLIYFLAQRVNITLPDDLTELIESVSCFKCLTETQMKQSWAAFLWEQSINVNSTLDEIMPQIRCLLCADPQTIKALYANLLRMNF